jgi:hypothetical protein
LAGDWEERFKANTGMAPEKRAGGAHPNLARQTSAQSRRSPHDGWLNEVAVELADFGLTEVGRNLDKQMGGAPVEGQLKLEGESLVFFVTLFGSEEHARQGEIGLRANPKTRDAIAGGYTALTTIERVQYLANGRGKVLDDTRFRDVIQVIRRHGVPQPAHTAEQRSAVVCAAETRAKPESQPNVSSDQIFEQIKKLGDLHAAGLLTDAEFQEKKSELLARL